MNEPASIPIWDPLVRVFHWTLAVLIIVDYWFTEAGSDIHNWIGYAAVAAVAVRIAWGFVGAGHARFDDFTVSLGEIREHLQALSARRVPLDSGHNPLGAMMVYLVFFLVAVLAVTGWLHEEVDVLYGNDLLHKTHELAAHTLWISALIHVASVFLVQQYGRVELVRPMITGRRRRRDI